MRGSELLDKMELVDPAYVQAADTIYEAGSKKHNVCKRWTGRAAAAAACLCIAAVCGLLAFQHMRTTEPTLIVENIENMEELLSLYGDTLLTEKLVSSDAENTTIRLSHAETESLSDISGWKTLSVSTQYPDYSVVMTCSFQSEEEQSASPAPIDTLQYGDTAVLLYQDEPTPEFAYIYRATFEYEGVFYDLSTQSYDPESIYELLDNVFSGAVRTEEAPHTFASILGFSDYHVRVEESTPGFFLWRYYAEVDGETKCIASTSGYVSADGGPEAYSADLDGDGVPELICNTIYGTGAERVSVFRNNNGVIEEGVIREKQLETQFQMSLMWGSGSISEKYDPAQNAFVVIGPDEDGNPMTVSFSYDLEFFYFYPYPYVSLP